MLEHSPREVEKLRAFLQLVFKELNSPSYKNFKTQAGSTNFHSN
jgi:hypothetical protein